MTKIKRKTKKVTYSTPILLLRNDRMINNDYKPLASELSKVFSQALKAWNKSNAARVADEDIKYLRKAIRDYNRNHVKKK